MTTNETSNGNNSNKGNHDNKAGSIDLAKALEEAQAKATEKARADANASNSEGSTKNSEGTTKMASETKATMNDKENDSTKALEDAKAKAEENWNLFLRTRADMDNLRRRAEIDVENARKYSLERFARELISVIDSLEHGLAVAESEHDAAYREGMALTKKLFLDIFEKFGINELNPIDQPFDPNKHEAISTQINNEIEPNRVLVVAQKGFILNDRVLRPARVIVSKREG